MILQHYISDTVCSLQTPSLDADCSAVNLPSTPAGINCVIDSTCLGFECCIDMNFIVVQRSTKAFLAIDPCDYRFTAGLGEWFLDVSFFTYELGTEITEKLGNAITIKYVFKLHNVKDDVIFTQQDYYDLRCGNLLHSYCTSTYAEVTVLLL